MLSLYAHIFARITPPQVIRSGVSTATVSAYMASFSWSTSLLLLPVAQPLVWRCLLRDRRHTKGWPAAHLFFGHLTPSCCLFASPPPQGRENGAACAGNDRAVWPVVKTCLFSPPPPRLPCISTPPQPLAGHPSARPSCHAPWSHARTSQAKRERNRERSES